MSLNHSSIIKLPWQEATPERTLDIFDLPKYYVDVYGVRNVEFQSNHVAQNNDAPDLAYVKELRARLDAAGSKANQINIEIGTMAQMGPEGKAAALAGDARAAWLARAKKWVDLAPVLGVTRLMHNQGALTDDSKAGVISLWKELQDYARPKNVMISGETRGSGFPTAGNRGQGRRRRHRRRCRTRSACGTSGASSGSALRRPAGTRTSILAARRASTTSRSCTTRSRDCCPGRPAACTRVSVPPGTWASPSGTPSPSDTRGSTRSR